MQEVATVEAALEQVEDLIGLYEGAFYRLATDLGDEEMLRLVYVAYLRQFDAEAPGPKAVTVQW